ncbi:hypothetical protein D1002_06785, partial [Riemerella anatipestifer]|nr:hypothetical protein [Riemerella anatipestifer]
IFALSCSFISFYSKNNILIFSLINNSCFFHFIMHNGLYIVYLTSKPDGVKNLVSKGVKKYPLFEQRCGQKR